MVFQAIQINGDDRLVMLFDKGWDLDAVADMRKKLIHVLQMASVQDEEPVNRCIFDMLELIELLAPYRGEGKEAYPTPQIVLADTKDGDNVLVQY